MKFIVSVFLTALLSFAMALFFPWWIVAVVAFVVAALIPQKPFLAFLAAFVALLLVWGVHAFIIDQKNNHILAPKVAAILGVGNASMSVILITAVTGAIVAGFGALTGSLLRRIISKTKDEHSRTTARSI